MKGGFICEDDEDEFSTLVIRWNMQQYTANTLGLVIAPTFACNLAYIYCFECPSQGIMDDKVMEGLVTFVKKYIDSGIKRLAVTWYGGEPLLGIEVIEKLSEKFITLSEENKINYSAFIITIGLRVNVDKTNIDQTISFFENLKQEEWFCRNAGKNISFSYGHVQKAKLGNRQK